MVEILKHNDGRQWLRIKGKVVGSYGVGIKHPQEKMFVDHWRKMGRSHAAALAVYNSAKTIVYDHPQFVKPVDVPWHG